MNLFRETTLAVLAAALPLAAAAGDLPAPVTAIGRLVGTWQATGSFESGGERTNVELDWSCRSTSAQHGVACTGIITGIPGVARYEETDLFGWEPNTNLYHWYSVTNAGETHDHVAQTMAGNAIRFVFDGTQEGKPLKEVVDFKFADDGQSFALRAETFADAVSASVLGVVANKSGAAR